jgi:hypothetical protein
MNPTPENARVSGAGTPAAIPPHLAAQIDETLQLIATASVPPGLEERIHAALGAAPRQARILPWPASAWPSTMRAAAAAAIVVAVTGGGWGVYTRVQHLARTAVPAAPQIVIPAGGFSTAGAVRTPQSVPGTAVQPDKKKAGPKKPAKKKILPQGLKAAPSRPPVH